MMVPTKHALTAYKKRNRISTIRYVIGFGLVSALIMSALAAAAMHTQTGHVLLSHAIDYVFG